MILLYYLMLIAGKLESAQELLRLEVGQAKRSMEEVTCAWFFHARRTKRQWTF